MITTDQVPVRSDNFIMRAIGDETILINQEGNFIHTLDETGTFIWKNINGENTISIIIDKVCEEYDVEKNTAKKDILEYINKLLYNKLIAF